MPSGPIGSSWASGSWPDTAWEANTWANEIEIHRIPVEEHFGWQRPVLEITGTPPGSPVKGDRYLVGAGATGDWSGHDDDLAWFNGTEWKFDTPGEGWGVFNIDDSTLYFLIAGVWTAYP